MSIDYINLFKKRNHFTHLHSGKHIKFILLVGIFLVVTNYDEHTLYPCYVHTHILTHIRSGFGGRSALSAEAPPTKFYSVEG